MISRMQPNVNFKGLIVFTKQDALNTDHIESMEPVLNNTSGVNFCCVKTRSGATHRCILPEGVTMPDVFKAYALAACSKNAVEYVVPQND